MTITVTASGGKRRTGVGHVYVLPEHVGGRPTIEVTHNAAHVLLGRFEPDIRVLIPDLAVAFDALRDSEDRTRRQLRLWAPEMIDALHRGGPWPTPGGRMVSDWSLASTRQRALAAAWSAGWRGATAKEARRVTHARDGGGISGSLTLLADAGVLAVLEETR